jgi:hypothetical protein
MRYSSQALKEEHTNMKNRATIALGALALFVFLFTALFGCGGNGGSNPGTNAGLSRQYDGVWMADATQFRDNGGVYRLWFDTLTITDGRVNGTYKLLHMGGGNMAGPGGGEFEQVGSGTLTGVIQEQGSFDQVWLDLTTSENEAKVFYMSFARVGGSVVSVGGFSDLLVEPSGHGRWDWDFTIFPPAPGASGPTPLEPPMRGKPLKFSG